jgi:hypothetical protein
LGGWSEEDWLDYFEERATIREHDGGLSRTDAEPIALGDCAARWRAPNPLPASGDSAYVDHREARATRSIPESSPLAGQRDTLGEPLTDDCGDPDADAL